MENFISLIKTYLVKSGYGYSTIKFRYRGVLVDIALTPVNECKKQLIERFKEINKGLAREIYFRRVKKEILTDFGAEIDIFINPINHGNQYVVRSYTCKGIKETYVSCYISQNVGGIKPVYGDIDELRNDLKRIM